MARLLAMTAVLGLAGLAGAQAVPTLKAKTRIVPIDVVVTDKDGRPVKGLREADFALTENGVAQKIEHFEAHTSLSAEDVAKLPAIPKLDANVFTDFSAAPVNGPLTVLVFDALNTKVDDQGYVLKQMQKYLETPHLGVRIELFELNSQLRLLQGFTADQEILRATLANRKSEAKPSRLMQRPSSDTLPITNIGSNYGQSIGSDTYTSDPIDDPAMAKLLAKQRQISTLDAMVTLARYMGGLPGRKNLLWFSESFPIAKNDPMTLSKLHEAMSLFAKNQVAVYPVGSRGLIALPVVGATAGLGKLDAEALTMDQMAEDTGGKAFTGSNDIAGAIGRAVEDGSNYYTLTYTPTNKDWKGEFRKVQVKLEKKGYKLAYRPGYYADDVDEKPENAVEIVAETRAGAANDPAMVALHKAMEYGSPQPAGVVFKAAVNPATGRVEEVVARGNSLSAKTAAPFERYVISVAALPGDFTFVRRDDGKVHLGAQMVTCVYSAEGALENVGSIRIDEDVDEARYEAIRAEGMKFQQEISVPVKGESFLRIGVEDLATSKVGVVEVPVAMLAKLKPLGEK